MFKLLNQLVKFNSLHCVIQPNLYSQFIVPHKLRYFGTSCTMFKSSVYNLQDATQDQVQEFLNSFDTVLTDCDGEIFFLYDSSYRNLKYK